MDWGVSRGRQGRRGRREREGDGREGNGYGD